MTITLCLERAGVRRLAELLKPSDKESAAGNSGRVAQA